MGQDVTIHPTATPLGLTTGKSKPVRKRMCAGRMDAMVRISSVLMFRKLIAMTTVGMSLRFAEHVTIGQANSMSILISFRFQVTFNEKFILRPFGCESCRRGW